MQFSTFFTAVAALAAGANAAAIKTRQEALATLEAYNFSTCDVQSVLEVEIVDQDCHDFDHGYGNAQATLIDPEQNCMRKCFLPKPPVFSTLLLDASLPINEANPDMALSWGLC